eukprot:SAG31_NODE_45802_length_257_cov_0.658228_1_plen_28_part_01
MEYDGPATQRLYEYKYNSTYRTGRRHIN